MKFSDPDNTGKEIQDVEVSPDVVCPRCDYKHGLSDYERLIVSLKGNTGDHLPGCDPARIKKWRDGEVYVYYPRPDGTMATRGLDPDNLPEPWEQQYTWVQRDMVIFKVVAE